MDPRLSRWVSADPALQDGRYFPKPYDFDTEHDYYWYLEQDTSKKLPGIGGVFNAVNMDVYHYGGNNPVKLVDPDGQYVIDRVTIVNENEKWGIRFHSDKSRSFLNKIKYFPGGSTLSRLMVENSPFGDFYYDSSMSDTSTAVSTLLDIAGSVSAFGKVVNWLGTMGNIANTSYGNYSDAKKDQYRKKFLSSAGLMSDKYLKGYNPKDLKQLMDAVDGSIAYYDDEIKGSDKDKGFNDFAKSLEDDFKNRIIPAIKKD